MGKERRGMMDPRVSISHLRVCLHPHPNNVALVYMLHLQARLAPRGPYASASPLRPPPACLAVGSANGVNAWLLLAPRGCASGGTLASQAASAFLSVPASSSSSSGGGCSIVSLRLLLQNATQDSVLVPFQRFRIALDDTAAAAAAAVRQARTISTASTATSHATASSSSSNDGSSEDEEDDRQGHHHDEGGPHCFREITAADLEHAGVALDAVAHHRAHLIACNDVRLDGGARVPWDCFEVRLS